MSLSRPSSRVPHLPSHSGDFLSDVKSWQNSAYRSTRQPISRGAVGIEEEPEEEQKATATKLRVWWHNSVPSSGRRRTRLSRRSLFTRSNIALLTFCVSLVYLWSQLSRGSSSLEKPALTVVDESRQPAQNARLRSGRNGKHIYRSDGLLELNPNATHPVFDLMAKAEAAWHKKLRRASVSFHDALEEYVRRYKRPPPKGFDKWWEYVQENRVQLPDEYDIINERLEPFWGIRPLDLRRIMSDWEDNSDVPVMVFGSTGHGKPVRILKNGMPEAEASMFAQALKERLSVLEDVQDYLPEFRAIISPGDTPNLSADWELLKLARAAAQKGAFIDVDGPPPAKAGWLSACEPNTPIHKLKLDFYAPIPSEMLHKKKKTFIYDHLKAMDPCLHAAHLFLNGQYLAHYEGPTPHRKLIPQFSSSVTRMHYDLLPLPPSGWGEERLDIPWEEKYDERLLWRGQNTGMMCTPNTRWRQSQRFRLVEMTNQVEGDVTVLKSPGAGEEDDQVGEGERWPRARLNPAIMDIAFSGNVVQCEEPTCSEVRNEYDWKRYMDTRESGRYKYVIDVDGNGWSSRFKRLMLSNSLIFKSTSYPEWFADRIQPWVHYIPISLDFSELHDVFVFFRGDLTGASNHDDLAKKIALEGSRWAKMYWRSEDATAYMFRLILEYARIISLDRDSMTMDISEYGINLGN